MIRIHVTLAMATFGACVAFHSQRAEACSKPNPTPEQLWPHDGQTDVPTNGLLWVRGGDSNIDSYFAYRLVDGDGVDVPLQEVQQRDSKRTSLVGLQATAGLAPNTTYTLHASQTPAALFGGDGLLAQLSATLTTGADDDEDTPRVPTNVQIQNIDLEPSTGVEDSCGGDGYTSFNVGAQLVAEQIVLLFDDDGKLHDLAIAQQIDGKDTESTGRLTASFAGDDIGEKCFTLVAIDIDGSESVASERVCGQAPPPYASCNNARAGNLAGLIAVAALLPRRRGRGARLSARLL